jgi:riboflavin synthase
VFSGLIEAVGEVRRLAPHGAGAALELACRLAGEPLATGESVAVSGACLTVRQPTVAGFVADLSPETLARTTLSRLRPGGRVNLERSLRLGDRLGGHLVLGHVDAAVAVVTVREQQGFRSLRVEVPQQLAAEVAVKGSITIDGVSLTVAALGEGWLEVALIPATLAATTLAALRAGDRINLETDVLAKYVGRALGRSEGSLAALWESFGRAEG